VYALIFVKPIEFIGTVFYSNFDIKVLAQGVYSFAKLFSKLGGVTRKWQNGVLSSYLFWMLIGLISLISYYFIKLQVWNF
jgi:NADH-quinone oxidoreductase subunit L